MHRARQLNSTDLRVFGIPFAFLVVLPLVCWLVVYFTQSPSGITSDSMFYLFVAISPWVLIPGLVFRQPLFDPVEIGYSPHGLPGVFVVLVFWAAISLIISLAIRYFVRRV
jgi:hypothetical protein